MLKSINKTIKILYVEDDDIARENGVEYLVSSAIQKTL